MTHPWERQPRESPEAYEAFRIYLELGADRSLKAVGQKLGKSTTLIERWSSRNRWADRVLLYDRHTDREALKKRVPEIRREHERTLETAYALKTLLRQQINEAATSQRGTSSQQIVGWVHSLEGIARVERTYFADDLETLTQDLATPITFEAGGTRAPDSIEAEEDEWDRRQRS